MALLLAMEAPQEKMGTSAACELPAGEQGRSTP